MKNIDKMTEREFTILRQEQLAKKIINSVDNIDITDEEYLSDIIKLCEYNKLTSNIKQLK